MASLTIDNIPDRLLEQLQQKTAAERRSLDQQILHLLEKALVNNAATQDRQLHDEIETQVRAWGALAGKWNTEESAEQETTRIYAARTMGREVKL
jgi:hypothetical protein